MTRPLLPIDWSRSIYAITCVRRVSRHASRDFNARTISFPWDDDAFMFEWISSYLVKCQSYYLAERLTIIRHWSPQMGDSEVQEILGLTDFQSLNLRNVWSGFLSLFIICCKETGKTMTLCPIDPFTILTHNNLSIYVSEWHKLCQSTGCEAIVLSKPDRLVYNLSLLVDEFHMF